MAQVKTHWQGVANGDVDMALGQAWDTLAIR